MKLNKTKISLVIGLALFICSCKDNKATFKLPVLGEKTINANGTDTIYHQISEFELINQYGEKVSNQTVKGKIYVANFFFATCQSICPEMSTNLTTVQTAFTKDDSLLILSHSVNPLHDTVEVLKNYAGIYSAIQNKWHLLTGNKALIYSLAKDSYLVNALEDDGTPEGFLHSELFLLIDAKQRIRGMYDGTDKPQVLKLIEDIKILKTEDKSL
jgi:protein SCO1